MMSASTGCVAVVFLFCWGAVKGRPDEVEVAMFTTFSCFVVFLFTTFFFCFESSLFLVAILMLVPLFTSGLTLFASVLGPFFCLLTISFFFFGTEVGFDAFAVDACDLFRLLSDFVSDGVGMFSTA